MRGSGVNLPCVLLMGSPVPSPLTREAPASTGCRVPRQTDQSQTPFLLRLSPSRLCQHLCSKHGTLGTSSHHTCRKCGPGCTFNQNRPSPPLLGLLLTLTSGQSGHGGPPRACAWGTVHAIMSRMQISQPQ